MRRLITFLVVVAVSLTGFALPGHAAGPDIITLEQLRAELDAQPDGIDGYFLTVPGGPTASQQVPVPVKMTVLAVADRYGPDGALIMFRADMADPVMKTIGGIAAGMSGSPLFIPYGGRDAMLGALSYGFSFTVDGLGLATPIQYMMATQSNFPPLNGTTLTLDRTVRIAGTTVRRVRIGSAAPAKAADTVTVRPLFGIQITGAPAGSAVYQRFASTAARKGTQVLPGGNGQCAPGGFAAPLEKGGSLGVYYSLGSAEVGGYGTVTYIDADTAMAFGHPVDWVGKTDLFATNAWVSGIWGSLDQPFKVGCPGQVRGAVTQDRSAAVGVNMAATTSASSATAAVSITTDTTRSATAATRIAQGTFAAGYGPSAAELAVTEPVYRVANQVTMPGSAVTTTTVSVTDGTSSFTITRPDVWSATDVLGVTGYDAYSMVEALLATPGVGARITSVHLDAHVDGSSRSATIASVRGGPLQVGSNIVTVRLKPVGRPPVDLPVTFTIPPGMSLETGLAVESGADYVGLDDETGLPAFASLAETVDWLTKLPQNDQLILSVPDADGNAVEVGRANTGFFLHGAAYPSATGGQLQADVSEAQVGDQVTLTAMPTAPVGAPITLQQRTAGSTAWQTVGSTPVIATPDGLSAATFTVIAEATTTYRASWPGTDGSLAWNATTEVPVSLPMDIAGMRKRKSWNLRVSSVPAGAGQEVVVQAKKSGSWADVAQTTLGKSGTATVEWRTGPASVRVRALTRGTVPFAPSTSTTAALSALTIRINPMEKPTGKGNITLRLRTPGGKPVTGVRYRVQRQSKSGWEMAASGELRKTSRLWLANGDYRVIVPQQRQVPARLRQVTSVSSAAVIISSATGGRGRATVRVLPAIPLRFTVQKLQAGQWLAVGGVRRLAPPKMRWSRALPTGRYRFHFPEQNGFNTAVSDLVRVR